MSTPSLDKDCSCAFHEGPCWLHTDGIVRGINIALLEKSGVDGFIVAELARLREKIWHMEHGGITEIPAHLCRPDLDERERAAWKKITRRSQGGPLA
jgi:hypothetical protein